MNDTKSAGANQECPETSALTTCRICGHIGHNPVYIAKEMMFGFRDKFEYFQCAQCECLQIKEYPADIAKYYPGNFYSYSLKMPEQRILKMKFLDYFRLKRNEFCITDKGLMGRLFNKMRPFDPMDEAVPDYILKLKLPFHSKILDIGCGNGRLLCSLRNLGYSYLEGVDPFIVETIKYQNGVVVHRKELDGMSGKYDFIMLHHSLEHMPNQYAVMKKVSDLLSRKGMCLVRFPTVSSYAWEYYKTAWWGIDAPRHYYLHSYASMRLLASKANLTMFDVKCDSTEASFLASEQYMRDIPLNAKNSYSSNQKTALFTDKQKRVFKQRAMELNASRRGDLTQIFLTKVVT